MANVYEFQAPEQDYSAFEPPPEPQELIELRQRVVELQHLSEQQNVAEDVEDTELGKLGSLVVREYDIDENSRTEWKERAKRAMEIAKQKTEQKNFPFENASNVKYPTITVAALQFAARAYPAICDGPRIVKCKVTGRDDNGAKAAAADRVSQHMSYQLGTENSEWEEDMDTCLHQIPIVGCAFKKVYRDPSRESGFTSDLISAFDLVVNKNAKSLERVPRATHCFSLYPHEIQERQRDGRFLDVDLSGAQDDAEDSDAPHEFLEQHRYYDLDEDGLSEPWIVTVHKLTEKVVRIRAGFNGSDIVADFQRFKIIRIPKQEYFVKIPFIPDPEGGFYDVGFGHLLDKLSDAIDTTINQMMDAGTLQNAGGGLIGAGLDAGKGKSEIRVQPGKYKTVSIAGNDIRQAVYEWNHPGPSKVLFELLGLFLEASKDITAVQDVLTGEVNRNQPATTTMALIEQGLKVFTAIYKRIFRALKREFKLVFEINKTSLDVEKYVHLLDEPVEVTAEDYQGKFDIEPVSDPASVTDMQKLAKAQLVLDEARNNNPHVDMKEATRRAFEAARVEDIEKVLIDPPPNPIAEMAPEAAAVELEQNKLNLKQSELDVQKAMEEIDKLRAEVNKLVSDAAASRAQVGIPIEQPIAVPQPMFEEPVDPVMDEPPMMPPEPMMEPPLPPEMEAGPVGPMGPPGIPDSRVIDQFSPDDMIAGAEPPA